MGIGELFEFEKTGKIEPAKNKKWRVEVYEETENILTIEDDSLSGVSNISDYTETIRKCALHLLSFIGDGHE